jgi:adenylate cyclase
VFCRPWLLVPGISVTVKLTRYSSGSGRFERDRISPGSYGPYSQSPPLSPPKVSGPLTNLTDHRKELSVLQAPQFVMRQNPPTAAPSPINGASTTSTPSFLNSSIFDSQEPFHSPSSLRPGTAPSTGSAPPGPAESYFPDEPRRPSVASVVTNASSTGSKSSFGKYFSRKIFGEGETSGDSTVSSESSLPPTVTPRTQYGFQRPTTPTNSRPRTPLPSAEVVPFLYQDPEVVCSLIPRALRC